MKKVYAMRSKSIHHGQNTQYKELLENFVKYIFVFFNHLLIVCLDFKSKDEFLNMIDDIKMS